MQGNLQRCQKGPCVVVTALRESMRRLQGWHPEAPGLRLRVTAHETLTFSCGAAGTINTVRGLLNAAGGKAVGLTAQTPGGAMEKAAPPRHQRETVDLGGRDPQSASPR